MNIKYNDYFEAKIYLGSQIDKQREITEKVLINEIHCYQSLFYEKYDCAIPVRISPTIFVDRSYNEEGWELGIIKYPAQSLSQEIVRVFSLELANHLLKKFAQYRISIIFPDSILLLEDENNEILYPKIL